MQIFCNLCLQKTHSLLSSVLSKSEMKLQLHPLSCGVEDVSRLTFYNTSAVKDGGVAQTQRAGRKLGLSWYLGIVNCEFIARARKVTPGTLYKYYIVPRPLRILFGCMTWRFSPEVGENPQTISSFQEPGGWWNICTNYSEDRRGNEVGKVELARTGPRWKNWK